ncbi:MAG: formylglycine-generating enzyme family protein [Acidobacteriia bacterium]|nr:formylglycine-generating enzyme family protein [Terriglobia bacterium]
MRKRSWLIGCILLAAFGLLFLPAEHPAAPGAAPQDAALPEEMNFSRDIVQRKQAGAAPSTQANQPADAITRPTPPYMDETFGYGREGHPALDMTYHAAMEYARWLSAKTGRDYRLPTEAEWEYACRAGSESPFGAGITEKNLGDYAWYRENSEALPHSGAQKKPNAWGIFDLLGNLAEWCLDLYDKDCYKTFKPLIPAEAPVLIPGGQEYPHVVRGGSWDDPAAKLRCAARLASTPDWSQQDPQRPQSIWWHTDALFVGFRVLRPLHEQADLAGFKDQVRKEQ